MTRTTNYESLQDIQDFMEAKRAAERSSIAPYEDPREFGRRVAVEIFEKCVKESDGQESSESETD